MRDYTGAPFQRLDPEVRAAIAPIDFYLRDLTKGMARIEKGEVPDGSGRPIVPTDGDFLFKPGISGGQIASGGTNAGENLEFHSTAHQDRGSILLGSSIAVDEDNIRLGINTISPTAKLAIATVPATALQANSDITTFNTQWGTTGAATQWEAIKTADDTTSFAHRHGDTGSYVFSMGLDGVVNRTTSPVWTVSYRARYEGVVPTASTVFRFGIGDSTGQQAQSPTIDATALTTSWIDYTTTVTFPQPGTAAANSLQLIAVVAVDFDGYIEITYVSIMAGGSGDRLTDWYSNGSLISWIDANAFANFTRLNLLDATGDALSIVPASATTAHTLTMPGAQGAVDTVLKNNGSGALSWVTISSLGGAFADSIFRIVGSSDATKKLAFEVDGFTTATTRTMTPPNASGTLALIDLAQTFTKAQSFFDAGGGTLTINMASAQYVFELVDSVANRLLAVDVTESSFNVPAFFLWPGGSVGTGFRAAFLPAALTADRNYTFPNATGTVPLLAAAQTFNGATTLGPGCILISSTAASGVSFTDTTTATKKLRVVMSGAVGNNTITVANVAARDYKLGDDSGTVDLIVAPSSATVDKTGQTASIGATTAYTTVHAGFYRMSAYWVFTAVTVAGTLTVSALYTDPQQAQTNAFINAVAFAAAGSFAQGSCVFYATTGTTIQFSTTLVNTGTYNIYVRVESLT